MSSLPSYVAAAKPVPAASRAAWYKNVAPTYAGIMLWFVFWQDIVTGGGGTKAPAGILSQGIWTALFGVVIAALICHFLFYFVPGMLGQKTGLPLYVVGTSTYGVTGGLFMPGFLMGLLAVRLVGSQRLCRGEDPLRMSPALEARTEDRPEPSLTLPCRAGRRVRPDLRVCRTERHSVRSQGGDLPAFDSAGAAHRTGGEDGRRVGDLPAVGLYANWRTPLRSPLKRPAPARPTLQRSRPPRPTCRPT